MKRISTIILLLVSMSLFAQVNEQKSKFLEVFKILPDSLFENYTDKLNKTNGISFIENSITNKIEFNDTYQFIIVSCLDLENMFFRYVDFSSDNSQRYEYKVFEKNDKWYIGFTIVEENHLTSEAFVTAFYEYKDKELIDVTQLVFNSFSFSKDNYTKKNDLIIDSIASEFYKNKSITKELTFFFTDRDTINILDNIPLYFDIDMKENNTAKYIMENGKLRLAE